jgi:hypothetical protein
MTDVNSPLNSSGDDDDGTNHDYRLDVFLLFDIYRTENSDKIKSKYLQRNHNQVYIKLVLMGCLMLLFAIDFRPWLKY